MRGHKRQTAALQPRPSDRKFSETKFGLLPMLEIINPPYILSGVKRYFSIHASSILLTIQRCLIYNCSQITQDIRFFLRSLGCAPFFSIIWRSKHSLVAAVYYAKCRNTSATTIFLYAKYSLKQFSARAPLTYLKFKHSFFHVLWVRIQV